MTTYNGTTTTGSLPGGTAIPLGRAETKDWNKKMKSIERWCIKSGKEWTS